MMPRWKSGGNVTLSLVIRTQRPQRLSYNGFESSNESFRSQTAGLTRDAGIDDWDVHGVMTIEGSATERLACATRAELIFQAVHVSFQLKGGSG